MTSPLSPEAVAQMVADREAGTPGPWESDGIAIQGNCSRSGDVCLMGEPAQYAGDTSRMLNNWEANARRIARIPDLEAAYLTLAAENARIDAHRINVIRENENLLNANIAMRASEAAAMERVKLALEIAKTRHIPDQPAAFGGSELEWAQRQYASLRRDIITTLTPTADKEPTT